MRITFLTLIVGAMSALTSFSAEKMPVLKVYFPGEELIYEEYTFGSMTLEDTDGKVTELPAKFKIRGATARQYPMKPSFNMKLETEDGEEIDENLLGIRKASSFILDAMAIDRICMRNRVCFDIWNSYSRLPYETDFDSRNGTDGKFVIVYMNDQYKGIYCLTDKINRKLLGLKKPQVESNDDVVIRGVLYKQGTQDVENQEIPGYYNDNMVYIPMWHDAWELKEPDAYPCLEAWTPLAEYYDNYNSLSYIADNFYEQNLIDYSLLVSGLCIADNWGNKNKYFSMLNMQLTGNSKRFVVTPWDLDTSLGGHFNGDYYDGHYEEWPMEAIAGSALPPFSLCFYDESCFEKMKQRWMELRDNVFSVENVSSIMYGYCNLFEESGAWAEQAEYWDSQTGITPKYVSNLRDEIDQIVEWYAKRWEDIDIYFNVADVESISASELEDSPIYNLQGVRIEQGSLKSGNIYISKGKKFIAY